MTDTTPSVDDALLDDFLRVSEDVYLKDIKQIEEAYEKGKYHLYRAQVPGIPFDEMTQEQWLDVEMAVREPLEILRLRMQEALGKVKTQKEIREANIYGFVENPSLRKKSVTE